MKLARPLALSVALCLDAMSAAHAQGDVEKGAIVFKKCFICHAVGDGAKVKVGPPLNDIVDAKAGAFDGYSYSPKLKELAAQGLTWTEENLHAYLLNPKQLVPGGKMAFPGLKKEEERQNVIAYLKTFSKP